MDVSERLMGQEHSRARKYSGEEEEPISTAPQVFKSRPEDPAVTQSATG